MLKYFIFAIILCSQTFPQIANSSEFDKQEVEEYSSHDGKIIREIHIRTIDVSGPSIEEKNGSDTSWFSDFVNSLHYTTRDWVVKNYLLFKEGDPLEIFDLAESERLLRESEFFIDAQINVLPSDSKDSVDLVVVTKDRWTLIFQLSLNAQKNSYAGLRDDNLLGLGHKVEGTITHDSDPVTGWGYKFNYSAKNVAATYIDITAGIETNKKSSVKLIDLSRSFVSLKTRFAGGLSFQRSDSKLLYINSSSFSLLPFANNSFDIWAGHSFPLWFGSDVFRKRTNIVTAARINISRFSERPFVSSDSNRIFANKTIYLMSTGIINRRFYTDHYVNKFGPTEDIPVGGMLALTGGYDVNEFSHRYYAGIDGVFSRRINNIGYFSLHTAFGGYYHNRSWEQNAYNFDILFHSELLESDAWKYRFFVHNNFLIGNNRLEQEQVFLDTENGLRGYERFMLHGVSKGLLKMEARIFSPFEPLGFALGANVFTDLGIISEEGENLFNSKIYQAYGAGLRISNESISDAHFDVALVFRPFTPEKAGGSFAVFFTSSMVIGSRPFNFSKPSVVDYGEN